MTRRAAIAAAGLALAVGACGGGDPPTPATPSAAPSPSRAATPPAAPPRRVRFRASDGTPVDGSFRPAGAAAPAPALVLVNGLVGGVDQWDTLTPDLHDAGYATLAYDGRGGVDEAELVKDVAGAVAFLRRRGDVDPRRIGIVGSSVGASTAVLAMTGPDRRRLRAAVALSPPTAPALVGLMERHRYHPHDVLFLSDHREQSSARALARGATRSRTVVSELVGHGVALLETEANRRAVLDWLEQHVG